MIKVQAALRRCVGASEAVLALEIWDLFTSTALHVAETMLAGSCKVFWLTGCCVLLLFRIVRVYGWCRLARKENLRSTHHPSAVRRRGLVTRHSWPSVGFISSHAASDTKTKAIGSSILNCGELSQSYALHCLVCLGAAKMTIRTMIMLIAIIGPKFWYW